MTKALLSFALFLGYLGANQFANAQDETFPVPMRFAILGDGVEQLPLEFVYDLEDRKSLRIGETTLNNETFYLAVGTLTELTPEVAPYVEELESRSTMLLIRWPLALISAGSIEAVGTSGRILWSARIRSQDVLSWTNRLDEIRQRMLERRSKEEIEKNAFFATTLGFANFSQVAEKFLNTNESFRFCISRKDEHGHSRICTPYWSFARRQRRKLIERNPEPERVPRVIAYQKRAPLKGKKIFATSTVMQFLAELSNGLIYEFVSRPPQIDIVEIVSTEGDTAKVVGFGGSPALNAKILNPMKESFLTRVFFWQPTIGDDRVYWEAPLSRANPVLYFQGPGGGLFRQAFRIERLPREQARPYLHGRTPVATYVDGAWLRVLQAPETKISTQEIEITPDARVEDELHWSFGASLRGEMNRAHVLVEDQGQKFKAFYEMYKGHPREISLRSSVVVGTSPFFNGEGAFGYWFEDLFGWTNYYLSRHRWGLFLKYFRSITPFSLTPYSGTLTSLTADLKYRLTPGLWNRDETWGLLIGYNTVEFEIINAKELGFGFFWARSMPKGFDDLFNLIKYFRYPKWVDLEFIYYPVALNPNEVSLRLVPGQRAWGNWALNFHGKMFFNPSWFMEGGFGVRSAAIVQETPQRSNKREFANFIAIYGTVGFGYQF